MRALESMQAYPFIQENLVCDDYDNSRDWDECFDCKKEKLIEDLDTECGVPLCHKCFDKRMEEENEEVI